MGRLISIFVRAKEGASKEYWNGVIYLYQAHKAETMMLAVHTTSMSPLVRQDVEMIQELILHICLWGGFKYCV